MTAINIRNSILYFANCLSRRKVINVAWQPIETAPKNGSSIFVLIRGAVYIVWWSQKCQHGNFEEYPGWQLFVCDDGFYSIGFKENEPTHWMPVPSAPPSEKVGG